MGSFLVFFALASCVQYALGFPAYKSLAGLSDEELDRIIPTLQIRSPSPPPGPPSDTSTRLVNDEEHPFQPPQAGDIRGPCPGLNTLASHGWLPRNGVATPVQIINAVQDGFNMGNDLATLVTYAAMLVDGNPITDLLSIGQLTSLTGSPPPEPATAGGLNTHAVFEGDVSMTRADAFFGDNHSFNETLFQEFSSFSDRYGDGYYNLNVAAQYRWQRVQDSIATNPEFSFVSPRYFTAYAESTFPLLFFVDGRKDDGKLSMENARKFFQEGRMPDDFYRARGAQGLIEVASKIAPLLLSHPLLPGKNKGVGNYVVDGTSANFLTLCKAYADFVNITVKSLYPNPQGALREALKANLEYFYRPVKILPLCPQQFPYGR